MSSLLIILFLFTSSFRNLECVVKDDNSRLNFFDTDLLRYAAEDHPGNVLVSPASIKSILALLLEGSAGKTAEEIRSALRLSPNKEEFREQLNKYLSMLKTNVAGTTVRNTNAAFVAEKNKLNQNYELNLKKVYDTDIFRTDFANPVTTTKTVNDLINRVTNGLIPEIVEASHFDQTSNILLTNAIYFKGSWKHSFDAAKTHGSCFYNEGICKMVETMELHAELNYAFVDNLRAHAVELPYEGGRYSMIILVPHEREGWRSVIRDLPYMNLPQISRLLEPTDVSLSLPKFTIDYSADMVGPLENMKISTLFSTAANLTAIFDRDIGKISHIIHKVHMSVDEMGTIAAAATSAFVIPLIENGVQLKVDRPFVFFIKDNNVGLVLFEGKISSPKEYVKKIVQTQRKSLPRRSEKHIWSG